MTPAYALLRRSRSHQDLSISDQRAAVTAWAEENGYMVVREFADDGSGLDTAKRREFSELLQVCADKARRQADVVLCYDVSRFSRLDADEAAWHEHEFKRAGVRVLYTHDPGVNESGLAGTMVKGLKRAMANEFSMKLSRDVTRGLRSHAALGHWTGGRPPYGYRRAVRTATGTQVLEPGRWKARGETVVLVPELAEAAIVREIFEAYVAGGRGLLKIAGGLNARGVPVATLSRPRTTSKWSKVTLHALLRNPIYIGTLVYAKARYSEIGKKRGKTARPVSERIVVEGAVPPIIDRALWDSAQAKHGTTSKFGAGRAHAAYLLSGLILCEHCGRRFRGHRQFGTIPYSVYVCGSYHDSGAAVCDSMNVRTDYLEATVIDGIQKRIAGFSVSRLVTEVRALLGPDPHAEDVIAGLETNLAAVTRKLVGLVEMLGPGTDMPTLRRSALELERERERIERELVSARARRTATADVDGIAEELVASLAKLTEVLEGGDAEARRDVVRAFLDGVTIRKTTRQAVLRWKRIPTTMRVMMVELRGFEPLTPRLPALCSPN